MKITRDVREFAAKQNAGVESFVAAEEVEAGMADMSRVFRETGTELYMSAGGREHDRTKPGDSAKAPATRVSCPVI